MATKENNQEIKKKGIFNLFKSDKKAHGGCCDMKIVSIEEQASVEASENAKNKDKKDNPGSSCCGGSSKCC